jgi:capsular exopolysaccharide synthesis family protein
MTTRSKGLGYRLPEGEDSALLGGVRVVRERWRLIVASVLICLVVAVGLAVTSTKQYSATSTLLINASNLSTLIDQAQAQTVDPARQQADYLELVQSSAVASLVKTSLRTDESVADLLSQESASADPNTDLLSVTISDTDPARAARIANGFANSLVNYLTNTNQQQITAGEASITQQLDRLSPSDTRIRSALESALSQVVALRAVTNGDASVVDYASAPSSASSPNVKRDAAVGLLAGIVLGFALVFLLDIFDRRVKTVEELEELYGLPALTSIPLSKRRPVGDREIQAELEPFRILRDGLAYISLREDTRVILVTSAVPGEGKTRVAIGLARALAVAGRNVVLAEADLHRPGIVRELGVQSNGRGLTNSLVEGTNPLEMTHSVPGLPSLSVLPAGPPTRNSAELLGSPAMASALSELANEYEFVVLDGPPLLPVADTHVLLDTPMIDVCLLVARPYLTTRDQVRGALAVLDRHREKGMGLVVNAVRQIASDYYHYATGDDRRAEQPVESYSNGASPDRGDVDDVVESGSESS